MQQVATCQSGWVLYARVQATAEGCWCASAAAGWQWGGEQCAIAVEELQIGHNNRLLQRLPLLLSKFVSKSS
jgi:hypothetical protein